MRALARTTRSCSLEVPPHEGRLLSWLHANADVEAQETADSGTVSVRFRIGPAVRGKLEGQLKRAGLVPSAAYAEKALCRHRAQGPHDQEIG